MADDKEALTAVPAQQDAGIRSTVGGAVSGVADALKTATLGDAPAAAAPPPGGDEGEGGESRGGEAPPPGAAAEGVEKGTVPAGGKKDPRAAKKAERLAARQNQQQAAREEDDPLAANYGSLPLVQSVERTGREWTPVAAATPAANGRSLLLRARVHNVRGKGKTAFLVLRERGATIQCVLAVGEHVSKGMVKFASGLSKESIVDVEGVAVVPEEPIESCTQQVEIQVRKIFEVSRSKPSLPLTLEDASRKETKEDAKEEGVQLAGAKQDTRLNFRWIDLRTPANQGIFRIQSAVGQLFRDYLLADGFVEIHSPKLMAGASEGGSSVFTLKYLGGMEACLAQSPQLVKQMAICADFGRVFEVGPVFRAEDSNTHRHLCEFTGLDFEMEIKEHYAEVLDVIEGLFIHIFEGLNSAHREKLEAIRGQYPFEDLKYLPKGESLRLTFAEGVEMLKEAGHPVDEFEDINTAAEKKLGELVTERFGTEFYIMHRYPVAARPFYTMPCADDPRYTNSFDVFIRGEEIISGAQRIHDPELLAKRAKECGIKVETIASYIDSFSYGAPPHGGAGIGLERVVMLFCDLKNIRKTSLFPRDPNRLTPP